MSTCANGCGRTLSPVEAVLSKYCRPCADSGHATVTGSGIPPEPGSPWMPTAERIESILHAYLVTVLWSSVDEDRQPLDARYSPEDIDPESVDRARSELVAFLHDNRDDLAELPSKAIGHNFALTRDRHGAGFWDMGLGERGDRLTAASHPYGDTGAYVGDDGQVYLS